MASECPDFRNTSRVVLRFSAAAQGEWEQIFNQIEYAIRPGGAFCETRDYASKVAENIARVAGIFHAFEGCEGTNISVETLRSAAQVTLWYTGEFVRLFSPPGPQDVINNYARLLDQWLIDFAKSTGQLVIHRNDLLQIGPNKLRSRDVLNIAVERLSATNRVFCRSYYPPPVPGRKAQKGTHVLELSDAYYGRIARGQQPWGFEQL